MSDTILRFFTRFPALHFNVLFLLGLAVVGGTFGGRLFQKIRIPQVVGYIVIGIVLGQTGLNIVDGQTINALQPFNYFALGLIGFMIGGELKKEALSRYGRQLTVVLLLEGLTAFVMVAALVTAAGMLVFERAATAVALGLLTGAIASATAPAATTGRALGIQDPGPAHDRHSRYRCAR